MEKKTIFIVKYSEGSYEDYYVHDVAAFINKEDALNSCKEVDKINFHQKSEISDDIWDAIEYEYDEIFSTDPEVNVKIPYDKPGGKEEHERVIKYQEDKFIEIMQKHYPEWSIEKCAKEKEIKEFIEDACYRNYSEAWIDEIDLYI